jgi:hypothetical protein
MSNADRERLRELQDRYLSLPGVQRWVESHGQDAALWRNGPTARQLRQGPLPEWEGALRSFVRHPACPAVG